MPFTLSIGRRPKSKGRLRFNFARCAQRERNDSNRATTQPLDRLRGGDDRQAEWRGKRQQIGLARDQRRL
jgi:hypothetical protein